MLNQMIGKLPAGTRSEQARRATTSRHYWGIDNWACAAIEWASGFFREHPGGSRTECSARTGTLGGLRTPVQALDNKAHPMSVLSTVFAYHERTKHHFHRDARSPGSLDWANQPHPFRYFRGATQTRLELTRVCKHRRPSSTWNSANTRTRIRAEKRGHRRCARDRGSVIGGRPKYWSNKVGAKKVSGTFLTSGRSIFRERE